MIFGKKVQWGWLYSGMYVQLSHFINPSRWEQYSLMALIRGLGLTFCFVSQTWLGIHKPQVFWRFHQNNTKDKSMGAFPTGKIWKIKTQTSYWFQIVKGPLLCIGCKGPTLWFSKYLSSCLHWPILPSTCTALVPCVPVESPPIWRMHPAGDCECFSPDMKNGCTYFFGGETPEFILVSL